MKNILIATALVIGLSAAVFGQECGVEIIPRPASVTCGQGHFTISSSTRIVASDQPGRKNAAIFNDLLYANFGFRLKAVEKAPPRGAIVLDPATPSGSDEIARAAYILEITRGGIRISGTETGQFYALQSLVQMMPSVRGKHVRLAAVKISDSPRFRYRGMHLDVARHFMPVSFVKRFIDLMSQYKLNYFHWHLTEDQGWRIEIKKYPRLTEVGSIRSETVKERNLAPYIGDGVPHGGFYTQEEIRDVVAYAKDRHITVIPEIELPGHASAALAAYPQFGCKQDYQYKVQTTWGIFKEVFCPTDETFKFLEDVLTETIGLFPDSPYIHIGGDEVLKDHWKESAFVQELKKRENLKDEHEVQSYFIRRIEKFLNSRGKKMIGWDEILEGGLAPNATVMSWRGMRGGIEAAKSKHDVIMTPTDYVYFDYGQGDPAYEPLNIGNHVPLERVYSFEPVPPDLKADEAKYVIGGQANLWTEYMKTPEHVEYMAFPRMLALAEVVWSPREAKNFPEFERRMRANLRLLDRQRVNYRIPEPGGLRNLVTDSEETVVSLLPADGTSVHYTLDGTTPSERSPRYAGPIKVTLNEGEIKTLKTVVINALGRKSVVYAATIVPGRMREPIEVKERVAGARFEFAPSDSEFEGGPQPDRGQSRSIQLNQFAQRFDLKRPFAVTFEAHFNAPADGVYEFQIESTWDAALSISGEKVIDVTGTKDRALHSAILPLKAGLHRISLRYDHRGGDAVFNFRWGIKGTGLRRIYGSELFQ